MTYEKIAQFLEKKDDEIREVKTNTNHYHTFNRYYPYFVMWDADGIHDYEVVDRKFKKCIEIRCPSKGLLHIMFCGREDWLDSFKVIDMRVQKTPGGSYLISMEKLTISKEGVSEGCYYGARKKKASLISEKNQISFADRAAVVHFWMGVHELEDGRLSITAKKIKN